MVSKKPGRPLVNGISNALIEAARDIMIGEGYEGLTVDRLATAAKTTRPTFYKRYPSVAHLAFEVIRLEFGTGDQIATGSLLGDLIALQRAGLTMMTSTIMRKNFMGLLEASRTEAEIGALYHENFLLPRRENVARILQRAIQSGEIEPPAMSIDLACDLLIGPILARVYLPTQAPCDDEIAVHTAHIVYASLGGTAQRGATA